jgi:hypothetical protein
MAGASVVMAGALVVMAGVSVAMAWEGTEAELEATVADSHRELGAESAAECMAARASDHPIAQAWEPPLELQVEHRLVHPSAHRELAALTAVQSAEVWAPPASTHPATIRDSDRALHP